MRKTLFLVMVVFIATILACGFNVSTASITDAKMAKDSAGQQSTTVFAQDDTFYCIVQVANAPDDTKVKAVWTAVEADGVDPNFSIGEKELTGGGTVTFSLSNSEGKLWPAGKYKVDISLNGKSDRTLEFKVEGQAKAAEPSPTPAPTATPKPEPTATPEPEPTVAPTEETPASTGDTLAPTAEATTEAAGDVLPLQDPYTHPSGAFTFSPPKEWKPVTEDAATTIFSDNKSFVGATFINAKAELKEADLKKTLTTFSEGFLKTTSDSYKLVTENSNPEKKVYFEAYSYKSAKDGDGNADIYLEQKDTVLFIIFFISPTYNQLKPTWKAIIDTYYIDPKAAASTAATEEPAPTPTKAPKPKPTPKPAVNPLAPPAGKGRIFLENKAGGEYYIDFGDGSGKIKVDPGAKDFYHDVSPGKFTPSISLFSGATVNAQFEVGPDQSWVILLDSDGVTVRWGKVYPK